MCPLSHHRLNEADGFLDQMMGLHLSTKDTFVLENGAEGWIAGLQNPITVSTNPT
jgi:ATP/maltotriose-dependent transcriptional regulator MalT